MSNCKNRTVLKKTRLFNLVRQERKGKKTWYEITVNSWLLTRDYTEYTARRAAMYEAGAQSGAKSLSGRDGWSLWNYNEANELFLMFILKWEV